MSPGKPTIVIVENDLPTLELYRRELSVEFQVLGTLDEQEALSMIQQAGVRAIILEPDWDNGRGWDLLALIRQKMGAAIPIVLCSSQDERRRGMELGAAAYLVKPVLPIELRDVLHRVLTSHRMTVTEKELPLTAPSTRPRRNRPKMSEE